MGPVRSTTSFGRACARTTVTTALALFVLLAIASAAMAKPEVFIVSQTKTGTGYYKTIQSAVEATKKGDWVLIEPGEYKEEVKVTKKHAHIFIRGMNRNNVVLNGEHKEGNGIFIYKADDVWVENLTVHDFDFSEEGGKCPDEECGNEIWWDGGAGSEKIGAKGWFGKYLTTYNTDLAGGYGIFAQNEEEGEWDKIYASGFADSGMYIGACPECKAVVDEATMEDSALGYSGSNSGGNLIIEKSRFAHNTTGIAPNSELPGDGPPPQNGACHPKPQDKHHKPKGKLPTFKSTEIEHCTIIRENVITENNNLKAPGIYSTEKAPWGAGVELPGDYGDLVEKNTITKNPSDGVLAFEYPNPFPPNEETVYFQNSGNKIAGNTFAENGSLDRPPFTGDVAFEGGQFGSKTSTNDCLTGNTMPDGSFPAEIENEWGCQNKTTPNPGSDELKFIDYLLELQEESEGRSMVEAGTPPPPQETMPNPCEGVPEPLAKCEAGEPNT